jgi:hypothetical protein
VHAQAVDRFGGEGDQAAGTKDFGRAPDAGRVRLDNIRHDTPS